MIKIWYPYWAWETWQNGFYSGPCKNRSKAECELLRKEFFLKKGLFEKTAYNVFKHWPVSTEHFLTDEAINRVAWLGQVCSLWHDGLSEHYSYAYNLLSVEDRRKNNQIAKDLINEWIKDRDNGGCTGIYRKVEKQRLQKGYTARVPQGIIKQRDCAFVQGDLFSDTAE